MTRLDTLYLRLYRGSLRVLPWSFRARHAWEMTQLVGDALADARRRGGLLGWSRRAVVELADVARTGVALRQAGDARATTTRAAGRGAPGLPFGPALRALRRRPAFAALTLLTLGLGVGAATAMFAVIDAVLLRPLPHAEPDRLVMAWRTVATSGMMRSTTSYPDYLTFRAGASAFADLAAFTNGGSATLVHEGEAERLAGSRVSGNLFRTLGNRAALGRAIEPDDDRPDAERTVVLSDGLWRRRFAADSAVVGRMITLNDARFRVLGVMPPAFAFPAARAQFWIPLRIDAARAERDANSLVMIGRLKPGVAAATADQQLATVGARLAAQYPGVNEGYGTRVEPRRDYVVEPVRQVLVLLGAAVAILLAIACANVAGLHLVRGVARRREIAVRRALGASPARILAEQLAEGAWVALVTAGLGVATAVVAVRALLAYGPALPRGAEIGVGARVVLFAIVAAAAVSLLAGLAPYVRVARARIGDALRGGHRSTGEPGAQRLQAAFMATQVALALVLVVGAGLLAQSFYKLVTMPRGFDGSRVLAAKLTLPPARYSSNEHVLAFYDALYARLHALPGVESSSGTWALPFSEDWASSAIVPAERPVPANPRAVATIPVREAFFRTVGATLRHGRDFAASDGAKTAPVAIVNETLARAYWGTDDVVGKQLRHADPDDGDVPITIVGVVADLKRRGLDVPAEPEIYQPHAQALWGRDLYVTLRTSGDPLALVPQLRRAVAETDPLLPLAQVGTLEQMVEATVVTPRLRTALVGGFALVAGLLALVGVYGAVSFVVGQRTHEIAVRGALGATPGRLLREVLGGGLRIAALGVVVGLAATALLAPKADAMLFGIGPRDAATYAAATLALLGAALLATWLPARRAAHVDPLVAMRTE